jgi:hypothetical protein
MVEARDSCEAALGISAIIRTSAGTAKGQQCADGPAANKISANNEMLLERSTGRLPEHQADRR